MGIQPVFYPNIFLDQNEIALNRLLARPSRRCLWVQTPVPPQDTSPKEEGETPMLILAYLSLVAPGA